MSSRVIPFSGLGALALCIGCGTSAGADYQYVAVFGSSFPIPIGMESVPPASGEQARYIRPGPTALESEDAFVGSLEPIELRIGARQDINTEVLLDRNWRKEILGQCGALKIWRATAAFPGDVADNRSPTKLAVVTIIADEKQYVAVVAGALLEIWKELILEYKRLNKMSDTDCPLG